jgi:hypothetical protein
MVVRAFSIASTLALVPCLAFPLAAADFYRGDSNADGHVDISDAVKTVQHIFLGRPVTCEDAVDTDDNGSLDPTDSVYLLIYFFRRGPQPPKPFPNCGVDSTTDALTCQSFEPCLSPNQTLVTPSGGRVDLLDGSGQRVRLDFSAGIFESPSEVTGNVLIKPLALLDGVVAPLRTSIEFTFDGSRLDSSATGGSIDVSIPASLVDAGTGRFFDDAAVFVEVEGAGISTPSISKTILRVSTLTLFEGPRPHLDHGS